MGIETQIQDDRQFIAELQECAKLLVERLENSDFEQASNLIQSLIEVRDRNIFNSVGKLTRALHNAIMNFHVDGDWRSDPPKIDGSEMQDASSRLNYVIQLTQAAADKTMDKVEATVPIAEGIATEAADLLSHWRRLKTREISADEFRQLYRRMEDFLVQMDGSTQELNKNLQDILLEQGFQDLTGQVLKRVIGLITEVESNLVNLMRIAGQVEEVAGIASSLTKEGDGLKDKKDITAEGPQLNADKRNDVVSGQDDVDDLLSSLGF